MEDSREESKMAPDLSSSNQEPEIIPRPCERLCGFYGNPATHDLCSTCYKDYKKQLEAVKLAAKNKKSSAAAIAEVSSTKTTNNVGTDAVDAETSTKTIAGDAITTRKTTNRCHICNKKVGLLGFTCRCGGRFCGVHRYPEVHSCKWDFKTSGRVVLAKENPVCKADKLDNRL